jgi:transcriptional regulator with XRE-family HTH domain
MIILLIKKDIFLSFIGVNMDSIEFGKYIQQIRDKILSRPAMADAAGLHVNTIKGYEMEGRLPDIDYLAALAQVTNHDLADLLLKRLSAGRFSTYLKPIPEIHFLQEQAKSYNSDLELQSVLQIPLLINDSESISLSLTTLPAELNLQFLKAFKDEKSFTWYLIDTSDTTPTTAKDGKKYLVDLGMGAVIKEIQFGVAGVLILADELNRLRPLVVPREQVVEVQFLGRVVGVISLDF